MKCAYCNVQITRAKRRRSHEREATRDHLIPKVEGEGLVMNWSRSLPLGQRVNNWKWVCAECNGLRAACGHCVGVMACLFTVAATLKMRPLRVLRAWNHNRITEDEVRLHQPKKRPRYAAATITIDETGRLAG